MCVCGRRPWFNGVPGFQGDLSRGTCGCSRSESASPQDTGEYNLLLFYDVPRTMLWILVSDFSNMAWVFFSCVTSFFRVYVLRYGLGGDWLKLLQSLVVASLLYSVPLPPHLTRSPIAASVTRKVTQRSTASILENTKLLLILSSRGEFILDMDNCLIWRMFA